MRKGVPDPTAGLRSASNRAHSAVVLNGIPASPGRVVAKVKFVDSETSIDAFPPGAVLVSYTTDPTLIEFMLNASAIVTAIGSRLCHTAIVALELGIPCEHYSEVANRVACR